MAESIASSREQSIDVTEVVEEMEELKNRKMELLQSIQQMKEYKYTQLTDLFLSDVDNVDDFILKIDNDVDNADDIFYEIIYSAKYSDRVSIVKLGEILDKLIDSPKFSELFFKFMKIFNSFKLDENLKKLIQNFKKLPNIDIAKHSTNIEFIQERNIITDYKKSNNAQTIKLVQQPRFNLLTESNEGYAKLIVLLNQAFKSDDCYFQLNYVSTSMEKLIGHFNLDPYRALEIFIDVLFYSITKSYRFALDLLKKSQFWPVIEGNPSSLETLDIGGNDLAAKIIASKLKYYADSERDLVESFKTGIAMFIKEGFVSFGSVIKYTGPDENSMLELKDYIDKSIDDQIFKSSANALALSGPLVDDDEEDSSNKKQFKDPQKAKEAEDKKFKKLLEINQKSNLTKHLLSNGVYWPAIYMLNKYPYLVHSDSEYPSLILRLFHVIIEPLKKKLSILNQDEINDLRTQELTAFAQKSSLDDTLTFEEFTFITIETFKPLMKSHTDKKFIYFYDEWFKSVPRANNYDDLCLYSHKILSFLGAKAGDDLPLVSYLCQFGLDDLKNVNDKNYNTKLESWFNYFKKFILPLSTSIGENPITSSEIYELLSKFPIDWRYNLYGDLYLNISKNDLSIKLNYLKAEKQTKDILKRITKDNVKPMMRRLAKVTYSNPLPSLLIILQQIENYDNLTNLIIEAARYFTDYVWDVLPFALLIRLTSTKRVAVQSDGLNDAPWLQSLSTFIGKISKTYSSFKLEPILTFILKDLHQNNTVGLTILKEIVNEMGGVQQLNNLSLVQIKLLNSSSSLQTIARKVIFDTRDESSDSAKRLIRSLVNSNQLSEIFILLFEFSRRLVQEDYENDDGEDSAYLKILSQKIDEISNVLHTYIELINYFLKDQREIFLKHVININELISKYKTDSIWCFELWRNYLLKDNNDIEITGVEFNSLTKNLYLDFWRFNLYDIEFDENLYLIEKEKLTETNDSIDQRLPKMRHEVEEKNKLKSVQSFNKRILEKIDADILEHKTHNESILITVKEAFKNNWFINSESITDEEIESFIQYCIIPRCLQSSSDAIFSVRFITNSFDIKTSQRILSLLFSSNIINTIIFTLTPVESENFGIFFAEIFNYFERVRTDETVETDEKIVIFNWHTKFLKDIKTSVKSENYMSRRNSITLLKNLIGIYPIIEDQSEELVSVIGKINSSEKRNDLKLASGAILALIHSKSKNLIHLWDFYKFEEEERIKLENERNEVLQEREDEKLRLKQEAIKKEREERIKFYQEKAAEERLKEEKAREEKFKEDEEEEIIEEDEDEIIEDEDEDDAPLEKSKKKSEKSEEPTEPEEEEIEEEIEEEAEVEEKKKEKEEPKKFKEDKVPTGPKGKFEDVTAGLSTVSVPKVNNYNTLRSIIDHLRANEMKLIYKLINDESVVKELKKVEKDNTKIQDILLNFGKDLIGPRNQAFRTFSDNLKKHFNLSNPVRQRKPLEPQESVSGFSNKESSKWGIGSNNNNNNNNNGNNNRNNGGNNGNNRGRQYNQYQNQGYQSQGYNQGYRNQQKGNVPPPPPPVTQRNGQQKRPSDRQRYDSDKRPRRN